MITKSGLSRSKNPWLFKSVVATIASINALVGVDGLQTSAKDIFENPISNTVANSEKPKLATNEKIEHVNEYVQKQIIDSNQKLKETIKLNSQIDIKVDSQIYEIGFEEVLATDDVATAINKTEKNIALLESAAADIINKTNSGIELINKESEDYQKAVQAYEETKAKIEDQNSKATADYEQKLAEYKKALEEYQNIVNSIPTDRDDTNPNGLNLDGGVSSVDGWKFMMTGSRDKVHEASAVVLAPENMSAKEATHHYLQKGSRIAWNKNTQIIDIQAPDNSVVDYYDGKLLNQGGSVKLTNVGTLADGTNVNIIFSNSDGDKNSWSISPREMNLDNGQPTGKIIIDSQDDLNLSYRFVDDAGNPLKIWLGNFFSDIDEPAPNYIQNNEFSGLNTNGIAIVARNLDINGYNAVRNDGLVDNHDSNLNSLMTITYSEGGSLRVWNSGSTKSTGYGVSGEDTLRMITPMFGEVLDVIVANKPEEPQEPELEEVPVQPEKPIVNVTEYQLPELQPNPEPITPSQPAFLPKTAAENSGLNSMEQRSQESSLKEQAILAATMLAATGVLSAVINLKTRN